MYLQFDNMQQEVSEQEKVNDSREVATFRVQKQITVLLPFSFIVHLEVNCFAVALQFHIVCISQQPFFVFSSCIQCLSTRDAPIPDQISGRY